MGLYAAHDLRLTRELSRYLVIPKFLDKEEADTLLARSKQLLDEFNIDDHPLVSVSLGYRYYEADRFLIFITWFLMFVDEVHDERC